MFRKSTIYFILILLFLPTLSTFGQEEGELSEHLYSEGLKSYILNDFENAITYLSKAYLLEPSNQTYKKRYVHTLIVYANQVLEEGENEKALDMLTVAYSLTEDGEEKDNLRTLIELLRPKDTLPQAIDNTSIESKTEIETLNKLLKDSADNSPVNPQKDNTQTITPTITIDIPVDSGKGSEESRMILENLVEQQGIDNARFVDAMGELIKGQKEERGFFQKSFVYLLIGVGIMLLLFMLVILRLAKSRNEYVASPQRMGYASIPSREQQMLFAGSNKIDERKFIGSENYDDVVKVKKLAKLSSELKSGEMDFDSIQMYLAELNLDIKMEILNSIETKSKNNSEKSDISKLLMSFFNDGKEEVRNESQRLLKELSSEKDSFFSANEEPEDQDEILSMGSLMNYGNMIDAKTGRPNHSRRVSKIVFEIISRMDQIELIPEEAAKAALIYDIGFLEISDEILKKETPLTKDEFEVIRSHTEKGLSFFSHVDLPVHFEDAITDHHERFDGSGYPFGKEGDSIPLIARVISVADMFNAAISPRPYKKALSPELAIEMMDQVSGVLIDSSIYTALKRFLIESNSIEVKK